ncbi:MAG: ABC transporter permease [Elusimicrobia bacterium]|nr:ABC transporter permease [Elusimicrobiota bacterium]
MIERLLGGTGRGLLEAAEQAGQFAMLTRSTHGWLARSRVEWRQALIQMGRIGVGSLPVSSMTAFFTGMVLALQTGATSKHFFNTPLFVGTVVSFALIMELGPVMTAIVVAGRAGAAIAAELGTMKVTEQVDALYTLGTDPVRYLVIPRLLAFLAVLPLLTVASDFAGVLGGYFVARVKYGIPSTVFWHDIVDNMMVRHFVHGFLKTFVFAWTVAMVCCFKGLRTRGGAEGVGRATTEAVVASMTLVLVLDYFATALLNALGIT